MSRTPSAAEANFTEAAPVFAALGDPTRLRVVARLCVDGPLSITRLSEGAKVTRQAIRKIERNIILKVLQHNQWNRKKAAKALNISYRALLYKLKEAGLQTGDDDLDAGDISYQNGHLEEANEN